MDVRSSIADWRHRLDGDADPWQSKSVGTIADFYDQETVKLLADGRKVALFTKHPGTLGAFREARFREYLKEHVPGRYTVASGFISFSGGLSEEISDRSSLQIDSLIYDKLERPALIESDSFVCVEPQCVAAFIEVKSRLVISREYNGKRGGVTADFPFARGQRGYRWGGSLVEALANIASAVKIMKEIDQDRSTYNASILAYDGNGLNLFDEALTSGEIQRQLKLETLDYLPDCICVLTSGWWGFTSYSWNDQDPEWDAYSYDDARSWMTKVTGGALEGAPLQLFTAYLADSFGSRAGAAKGLGGLRSGAGRDFEIENVNIPLPSPGRG